MLEQIQNQIDEWTENVLDGAVDPLEHYVYLKALKKKIDNSISMIQNSVIDEAKKYPEKSFEHLGFNFELRNGKSTYQFDHIDLWKDKKTELKRLEEISKASLKNGSVAIDSDTGEEIPPAKVSFSKDSLIVKL